MKTFLRVCGILFSMIGVMVMIAAGGTYLLTRPAVADFFQTVPGSGTTFAAVVIGGKQYVAHAVCDWVIGETQCANVTASGQVSVTGPVSGVGAAGSALVGSPVRIGLSDSVNTQNWNNATSMSDANAGTNWAAGALASYNGTTFDRVRGDVTNGLWVNCKTGCSSSTSIVSWAGATLGAMANFGSNPGAVLVPGVNAFVTNTNVNGAAADAASSPVALSTTQTGAAGTPSARFLSIQGGAGMTPVSTTSTSAGPYPLASTPIQASTTGTTTAVTATLAANATKTTYLCGFSIRTNATAAVTNNITVTGPTTTLNFTQWTAPTATGLGVAEMIFSPCIPGTAINTAVAVVSGAPGTGGIISNSAWGYQL
jgi:hypothetical protein